MKSVLFFLLVGLGFTSCRQLDVFEKTAIIPARGWSYDNKPLFSFTITDTLAPYNIFIVLRHTDSYQYNNIWLSLSSRGPGIPLQAQNIDLALASDKSGWHGNGMDDIFEVRKNITQQPVFFKRAGNYTFAIAQVMREDDLKHILNVGLRVEKVKM